MTRFLVNAALPYFAATTAMILACCASPAPTPALGSAPSPSAAPAPGSGLRGSSAPAPSSSSTASTTTANLDDRPNTTASPFGWWLVRGPRSSSGPQAIKIAPDTLWLVSQNGSITVRSAAMAQHGSSQRWHLDDGTVCTWSLVDQTHATLDCGLGALSETFSLSAPLQPQHEAELEQRVAAFGPAPTLCEKAIRCCEVASQQLSPGGPCDVPMEMGSPPQPDQCLGYLKGIRILFDVQKKSLPDGCL